MIQLLFNTLLNCKHKVWSWPMTIDGKTTRTCIECGTKRAYNWKKMEFTQPRKRVVQMRTNSVDIRPVI